MKAVVEFLKKISPLRFGLPFLSLLLPLAGQHWSESGWSTAYFMLFFPFFESYLNSLPQNNKGKMSGPQWGFLAIYCVVTQSMGVLAYNHQSLLVRTTIDALITAVILTLGLILARRLSIELKLMRMDKENSVPFDLTTETFRLPEQSIEPATYPRVSVGDTRVDY